MLCIILNTESHPEHRLALYGAIAGPEVEILAAEGRSHLAATTRLVLELDGVQFIDRDGLALLRAWAGPRLKLCGGSVFIRALLAAEGLAVE